MKIMTPSSDFASARRAVAGIAALSSLAGCLTAFSAEDATAVRITNVGRDSVAVYPWDFETSNRSLRTFGRVALRNSDLGNGLIAPGASRDFPFDSILGYTPGQGIRVEVLSLRRDSVFENHNFTITSDELERRGFSLDVSLR
jgi:hypothetical protein